MTGADEADAAYRAPTPPGSGIPTSTSHTRANFFTFTVLDQDVRCWRCGKLLIEMAARPWRVRCARCKEANVSPPVPPEPRLDDDAAQSPGPVLVSTDPTALAPLTAADRH